MTDTEDRQRDSASTDTGGIASGSTIEDRLSEFDPRAVARSIRARTNGTRVGAADADDRNDSPLSAVCYRSISGANENQWNNVVSQSDRGTLFHRYEWLRAVEDGFDSDPCHIVVKKRGNPVGLMPNFVTDLSLPDAVVDALPVTPPVRQLVSADPGFGGPVVTSSEGETVDLLFDALETVSGPRVLSHRVRAYDPEYVRYGRYLEARGYRSTLDSCLLVLDLGDGWEAIRENMDKERRRDLRKAHEQDYRVEIDPLGDDLETTYRWYAKNVDRVDGTAHPREFLEAIADRLEERVRVLRAVVDGDDVGRYVYLLDEEGGTLHHWLSAIPDAENYQYHPSELMHERAIKWGIERGDDRYSFGRTGSHFDNSVFTFKRKYGGDAIPLVEMETGYSRLGWSLYRLGRSLYLERTQ
ncbi:GNAT family N-acetyltransferase [Natrinema sp. LN54]|uniref:GNAT family N-acetyltransferase n=1 Tax=Natrinema sp. LN54 TaxID=3458705 RepID=UPI0040352677